MIFAGCDGRDSEDPPRTKKLSRHLPHDNPSGHCRVQRLRQAAAYARDGDGVRDARQHRFADAMRLAPDDDDALGPLAHPKQVLAVQQSTVDGFAPLALLAEENGKVDHGDVDPENGTHRGLNHLGIPNLHTIVAAHHLANAEPLRRADEGTHVARVGDAVQGKDEARRGVGRLRRGDFGHGQHAWWRVKAAHLLHLHFGDRLGGRKGMGEKEILCGIDAYGLKTGSKQLFDHFATFHDEEPQFLAEFLLAQ